MLEIIESIAGRHQEDAGEACTGIVFLPASESKQNFINWLHRNGFPLANYLHDHDAARPWTSSAAILNKCRLLVGSDNDTRGIDVPSASFVLVMGVRSPPPRTCTWPGGWAGLGKRPPAAQGGGHA